MSKNKAQMEEKNTSNESVYIPKTSINRQLTKLVMVLAIPFFSMIVALLVMLGSVNMQYRNALQNANIAADFNTEFKNNIDLEMWYHVIQPRTENSADELPLKELDDAVEVLHRLEKSTILSDNQWRINSMLNMCENLRKYMIEIAETRRYDDRMELLDRNIRGESGLTAHIETYMHDYIDAEVRELATLQSEINSRVKIITFAAIIGVLLLIAIILVYSVKFTKRITEPIALLAKKAERLGMGDFLVEEVQTENIELYKLENGFNEMVHRIDQLMEEHTESQKELHKAELELLQAQINPHFLYNTLDSIVILAESHRDEDVADMVTSLSTFFRNSLSRGCGIISLRAEKEQVTSYLEIQKIRYSDILNYKINIPDEFLEYAVPKLILQPLVENAIYHGTKNKRGMGNIKIIGESNDDDIRLSVIDDGIGMDEDHLAALRAGIYEDRNTGLGLVNVHKRVKFYCGEKYGLTFDSVIGVGTTVSILLPKNLKFES